MRRSLVHIKLGILFQTEKTTDERFYWVHQPAMLQKQERGQQNRVRGGQKKRVQQGLENRGLGAVFL